MRNVAPRKVWRFLEVYIFISAAGFFGFMMYWASWLSLVALAYIVPGVAIYGLKAVCLNPILIITASSLPSHVVGLLRLLVLSSLILSVREHELKRWTETSPGHFSLSPRDPNFVLSWLVDPDFHVWLEQRPWGSWANSNLRDDFQWAPSVTANDIFQMWRNCSYAVHALYGVCLLLASLHSLRQLFAPKATRCCGDVGENLVKRTADIRLAVQDILQKEPTQFREVNAKIKPVVGCSWPWHGGAIYPRF